MFKMLLILQISRYHKHCQDLQQVIEQLLQSSEHIQKHPSESHVLSKRSEGWKKKHAMAQQKVKAIYIL
jgi:hypothetical protein